MPEQTAVVDSRCGSADGAPGGGQQGVVAVVDTRHELLALLAQTGRHGSIRRVPATREEAEVLIIT